MPFVNAGVRADGALGIATVLMLDRPLPTTTHAGTRNIAAAMIHERDDASASDAGAWQVVPGACGTGTSRRSPHGWVHDIPGTTCHVPASDASDKSESFMNRRGDTGAC